MCIYLQQLHYVRISLQFGEAPINVVLLLTPVAIPYPRDMDIHSYLHAKATKQLPLQVQSTYFVVSHIQRNVLYTSLEPSMADKTC